MTANAIQHLYSDYRTVTEYPPDYTLDFFTRNTVLFNNIRTFENGNELQLYVQLTWQHLNALYQKDRFNDTADNAIKYLQIIDTEMSRLNLNSIMDDWYYGILLLKGMSLYRLRDYKASTSIFKQLVEHNTKNENYKNWLSYSKYGQRMWISKSIVIVCCILIAFTILFDRYIPSNWVSMSMSAVGLLGFLFTFLYDYYITRNFRKTKLKENR